MSTAKTTMSPASRSRWTLRATRWTGVSCSSSSSSRSDTKRASPRRLSVAKAGSGGAPAASAGAPRTYTVTRPRRIANTTTTTTSAGASSVQNNKKSKYVTLEPHLRTLWMDVRSREMKSSAHMYLKSGSGSVIW